VNSGSGLDERPIEEISVVGDKDVRLHVQDVVEKLLKHAQLVLKNKQSNSFIS
jgi:hypothetical protein